MLFTFDIFGHYENKDSPLGFPIQEEEYEFMMNAIMHLEYDVESRTDIVYGCIYKNSNEFEKHSKLLQGFSLYTSDFVIEKIHLQYEINEYDKKILRAFVADITINEESSVCMDNKQYVHKCKIEPGFNENRIITIGLILPVRYLYRKN